MKPVTLTGDTEYPLFFSYEDVIIGNGFIAEVKSVGKVLCAMEDDEVWMFGVQPAGIASCGADIEAAYREFRLTFRRLLHDFAAESPDAAAFESEVRGFAGAVNEENAARWALGVERVREGRVQAANLERWDASRPPFVHVGIVAMPSPASNNEEELSPRHALAA